MAEERWRSVKAWDVPGPESALATLVDDSYVAVDGVDAMARESKDGDDGLCCQWS